MDDTASIFSEDDGVTMTPLLGSYVLVMVDPVATVESLEDEIATAAARAMECKTYCACTIQAINIFDPNAQYQSYRLCLVGQGFPTKYHSPHVKPNMCVPIFPTTEHPSGREPIHLSQPLPWNNVYHHSVITTEVRVPYLYSDSTEATLLPDISTLRTPIANDEALHERLMAEAYPSQIDDDTASICSSRASSISELAVHDDIQMTAMGFGTEPHAHANTTNQQNKPLFIDSDHFGEGDDLADTFAAMCASLQPSDTMVVVDTTYNLSHISELPDPADFFHEMAYLQQLVEESNSRAIDRARKIDEEAYSTVAPNVASDVVTLDESDTSVFSRATYRFKAMFAQLTSGIFSTPANVV